MKWKWLATILAGALAAAAAACLWDRDTLAEEARGKKDILQVIVGRFERNPLLYYEIRLDRIRKEMKSDVKDLRLYDDAAVASDRLGKHDDAIDFMGMKKIIMDTLVKPTDDDRYRYHANLGTFHAHRWFKNGANRAKMQDLEQGIAHLRKALAINPNAHFGREEYQVAILDWVKDSAASQPSGVDAVSVSPLGDYLASKELLKKDNAVEGLAGLIRLGNAWESIDVFAALADALSVKRQGTLGLAARLRYLELKKAGKIAITDWDDKEAAFSFDAGPTGTNREFSKAEFSRLRKEADAWHEARTKFMADRLKQGRHPDTDPTFWDGYSEEPFQVRDMPFYRKWEAGTWFAAICGSLTLASIFAIVLGLRKMMMRRP